MSEERDAELGFARSRLHDASGRLVRTVDRLEDDDWHAPSLLPGWTRAHVVAHLALNAEGMTRALGSVLGDEPGDPDHPATMYDSDDQRGRDIDALAAEEPHEVRDRLLGAVTALKETFAAVPDDAWDARLERTPGGRAIRAGAFPGMRLRELEIHHADLGTAYTPADWDPAFSAHLLDSMSRRVELPQGFDVRPLDVDRVWSFGPDGDRDRAIVTGPAADAGWWLTGRPAPETLSCSRGELPSIEGW